MTVQDEKFWVSFVIEIHPEWDMNILTKFFDNPSKWEISLKTTNVNQLMALKEKLEDQ